MNDKPIPEMELLQLAKRIAALPPEHRAVFETYLKVAESIKAMREECA